MIVVQIHVQVKEGSQADFEALVAQRWAGLKQQPGFFSGKVFRALGSRVDYMCTEQWKSVREYEDAQPSVAADPLTAQIARYQAGPPVVGIFELSRSTWDQQ